MTYKLKNPKLRTQKEILQLTQEEKSILKKWVKKGRRRKFMSVAIEEPERINCMSNIRKIIQDSMKEQGITSKEARKALGIKRYEE